MAILEMETKARLTGDYQTFAGIMGGRGWVRVYRVILDGEPASDWVEHDVDSGGDRQGHIRELAEQSGEHVACIRAMLKRRNDAPMYTHGSSGWGMSDPKAMQRPYRWS